MAKLLTGNPNEIGHPSNVFNLHDDTRRKKSTFVEDENAVYAIPFISPKGPSGILTRFTASDIASMDDKYGSVNVTSQGLMYYALRQQIEAGAIVYGIRLCAEDATFANSLLSLNMKNSEKAVFYVEDGKVVKVPKVLGSATPILLPSLDITYTAASYENITSIENLKLLLGAAGGSLEPSDPEYKDDQLKVTTQIESIEVPAQTNKVAYNLTNATKENTIVSLDGLVLTADKYEMVKELGEDGETTIYSVVLKSAPVSEAVLELRAYTVNGPLTVTFNSNEVSGKIGETSFKFKTLRSEADIIVLVDGLVKPEGEYTVNVGTNTVVFNEALENDAKISVITNTSTLTVPLYAIGVKGKGAYGTQYRVDITSTKSYIEKLNREWTVSVKDLTTGKELEAFTGAPIHDVYTEAKSPLSLDDVFRTYSEQLNVFNAESNMFVIGDKFRGVLINVVEELNIIIATKSYNGNVIVDNDSLVTLTEYRDKVLATLDTIEVNADRPACNYIPMFETDRGVAELFKYGKLPVIRLHHGHNGALKNMRVFDWGHQGTRMVNNEEEKYKVLEEMYIPFFNGDVTKDIYDTVLFPVDIVPNVGFYPRPIQEAIANWGLKRIDVAPLNQVPYFSTEKELKEYIGSLNRVNPREVLYPHTYERFDKNSQRMLRIGTVLGHLTNITDIINNGFNFSFAGGDAAIIKDVEVGTVKPEISDLDWMTMKGANYLTPVTSGYMVDGQSSYIGDDETSNLCELHNIVLIGRIIKKLNNEVTLKRHRFARVAEFSKTIAEINATLQPFRKHFGYIEYVAGYKNQQDANAGKLTHNIVIAAIGTVKTHIFDISVVMPDMSEMMLAANK
ncbi:MAG: hypothetical protein ACRC92_11275 [Peptostreptococcaceae bacterium]